MFYYLFGTHVCIFNFYYFFFLAESIVTYAGERFDFILNADQPKDLYWIRFRGLMDCDERFKSAHQEAILEYDGVGEDELPAGDEPEYLQANRTGMVRVLIKKFSHFSPFFGDYLFDYLLRFDLMPHAQA